MKCSRHGKCPCPAPLGRSFLNEIYVYNSLQSALPSATVKRHNFGKNISADATVANGAGVLIELHGSNLYNIMFLSSGSFLIGLLP